MLAFSDENNIEVWKSYLMQYFRWHTFNQVSVLLFSAYIQIYIFLQTVTVLFLSCIKGEHTLLKKKLKSLLLKKKILLCIPQPHSELKLALVLNLLGWSMKCGMVEFSLISVAHSKVRMVNMGKKNCIKIIFTLFTANSSVNNMLHTIFHHV